MCDIWAIAIEKLSKSRRHRTYLIRNYFTTKNLILVTLYKLNLKHPGQLDRILCLSLTTYDFIMGIYLLAIVVKIFQVTMASETWCFILASKQLVLLNLVFHSH